MLKIKELLSRLVRNMDFTPIVRSWSNVALSTLNTWYRLTTITIPANSQYLILAMVGNGQGGSVRCNCSFEVVSGSGVKVWQDIGGINNAGAGNVAQGFAYIKTGSAPYEIAVRTYCYATGVTNCNGKALAIPLVLGGVVHRLLNSLTSKRRWAVC